MQAALAIAEMDASRERYKYNIDKTKTLVINSKSVPTFTLNNKPLKISQDEVHLGIHRTSDCSNKNTVEDRMKGARRAAYQMRDSGLRGLNGAGPEVAMAEYNQYVTPTLMYGLEALVLEAKEVEVLDTYHRKNLRYIMHLPQSTAIPAISLLLGTLPIQAQLDIKILTLFCSIVSHDNNNPHAEYIRDLVIRQLATTNDDSKSWARNAAKTMSKYNLPSA